MATERDRHNGMSDSELHHESEAYKAARKRADDIKSLATHAGVFAVIGFAFFFLNLVTSRDSWWFFYPMIPWGIGLGIHAWTVWNEGYFNEGWADRYARKIMDAHERHANPHSRPKQAAAAAPAGSQPAATEPRDTRTISQRAGQLIDEMRSAARQIPNPDVRDQTLAICASADRVLSAIQENPDEVVLANDFLNRYLTPANLIVRDYARLAASNVPSAQPTLRKVESHDLPQLSRKLEDVYDRLHRGRLIDLEVAREMLSLDVADWDDQDILPSPQREGAPRRSS